MDPIINGTIFHCYNDTYVNCTSGCNYQDVFFCGYNFRSEYERYLRKNSSGKTKPARMVNFIYLLISILALCGSVLADVGSTSSFSVSSTDMENILLTVANPENGIEAMKIPGTDIVVSDVIITPTNSSSLSKRWGAVYSYTQYQLAQQGTWWSPWYPVSQVAENGLGYMMHLTLSYSWTYTWSISPGISIKFGVITANFGAQVSESISKTETWGCDIPAQSAGQIWYQKKVAWGDLQQQQCTWSTGMGTRCGAWSQYYRVNAPLNGIEDQHTGCSVGWGNVRLN